MFKGITLGLFHSIVKDKLYHPTYIILSTLIYALSTTLCIIFSMFPMNEDIAFHIQILNFKGLECLLHYIFVYILK